MGLSLQWRSGALGMSHFILLGLGTAHPWPMCGGVVCSHVSAVLGGSVIAVGVPCRGWECFSLPGHVSPVSSLCWAYGQTCAPLVCILASGLALGGIVSLGECVCISSVIATHELAGRIAFAAAATGWAPSLADFLLALPRCCPRPQRWHGQSPDARHICFVVLN